MPKELKDERGSTLAFGRPVHWDFSGFDLEASALVHAALISYLQLHVLNPAERSARAGRDLLLYIESINPHVPHVQVCENRMGIGAILDASD